jgi:hypothetical protein
VSQDTPHPDRRKYGDRRARHHGGHSPAGRRKADTDPRTTFTKKFLVIVVALVNFVYLASEAFLSLIHQC